MSPDRSLKGPFQILMSFLAKRPVSRWQRIPTLQMQSLEALPPCSTGYHPQQLFSAQDCVSVWVTEKAEASIWWHWKQDLTLLTERGKPLVVHRGRKWRKRCPWCPYQRKGKVSEHGTARTCFPGCPGAACTRHQHTLLHPPAQRGCCNSPLVLPENTHKNPK